MQQGTGWIFGNEDFFAEREPHAYGAMHAHAQHTATAYTIVCMISVEFRIDNLIHRITRHWMPRHFAPG